MNNLLAFATAYMLRGLSVLPVGVGKRPTLNRWRHLAARRATRRELSAWFGPEADTRTTGVAVICGTVSDTLIVRDFDDPAGYERWSAEHPDLARMLPTVKTGKGFHVWSRIAKTTRTVKYENGELRGESSYVCAPPSLHESGVTYRWVIPMSADRLPLVDLDDLKFSSTPSPTTAEHSRHTACVTLDDAINLTLPAGPGQRNGCIFRLARAFKAIPSLRHSKTADLRPIVRQWHRAALSSIRTKPFDDTWCDFVIAWKRVHTPLGAPRRADVISRMDQIKTPTWATERYDDLTLKLIRLCIAWSSHTDGTFFLSVRDAAGVLVTDRMTACRRLQMLVADEVLEVVEVGSRKVGATTYRYLGGP